MTFIWMAIFGVSTMVLTTLGISIASKIYKKKVPSFEPVYFISGIALTFVSLISALCFGYDSGLLPQILAAFLILNLFMLAEIKLSGWKKELLYFLVCIGSVFLLPSSVAIFTMLPKWLAIPALGLGLYLAVRIFTFMDRVPDLSLITMLAQGVFLLLLLLNNLISTDLVSGLFYFFVAAMSASQTIRAFTGRSVLGPFAAPLAGFITGFLWLCITAEGYFLLPLILYSYDMMELALAGSLTLFYTRRLYPLTVPFLIEKAQDKNFLPNRLNRLLFFILLSLSFVSFIYLRNPQLLSGTCTLIVFVVLYAYVNLKKWGVPKPTFRDLKKDLKQGLSELKDQLMYIPLKKDKQKPASAEKTPTPTPAKKEKKVSRGKAKQPKRTKK